MLPYAGHHRGIADIICILPPNGTVLMLEVKTPTGKQSVEQVVVSRRVTALGGHYAVVRSVEDVEKVLSTLLT